MKLDQTTFSTDEVRQGETGHGVRYMLALGTAFVVVAFAITLILTV